MSTASLYLPPHILGWVGVWYLLASLVCFAIYAIDKLAAIAGRRRVSERALITWGLLGGWPGAIVAQHLLRHKTSKTRFLLVFWLSVVLNILVLLMSYFVATSFLASN